MKQGLDTPPFAFAPSRPPRPIAVFGSIVLLAVVLVAAGGMLAFIGPTSDPLFVPLWVGEGESIAVANISCNFPWKRNSPAVADRASLVQRLDDLRELSSSDSVVLYLRAPATLSDEGKICLLPADAAAERTQTWLPLQEVLTRLKRCPARQQLVLLELAMPAGKLESLAFDPSAFLEPELDATADTRRTVVCCDAAVRESAILDRIGRSPFALAVERALEGDADGWVDGHKDGRVSLEEMTRFVQTNVRRLSEAFGSPMQARVIGASHEFTLVSLGSRGSESLALPETGEYPARLHALWTESEKLRGEPNHDPRSVHRLRHSLVELESKWRRQPNGKLAEGDFATVERAVDAIRKTELPTFPLVFSLAQEPAVEDKVLQKIRDGMNLAFGDLSGVKPPELPKAQTRWAESLVEQWKDFSPSAREAGIFAWALNDNRHTAEAMHWADLALRKAVVGEPRTTESLALRQIADLAARGVEPWPAELAAAWLKTTAKAEKFAALPDLSEALRERWARAEESRRRVEVHLLAFEYSRAPLVLEAAREAERMFDLALSMAETLRGADATLTMARACLANSEPVVDRFPDLQPQWLDLVAKTRALAEASGVSSDVEKITLHMKAVKQVLDSLEDEIQNKMPALAKASAKVCEARRICDALAASDAGGRANCKAATVDVGEIVSILAEQEEDLVGHTAPAARVGDGDMRRLERRIALCELAGLAPDAIKRAKAKHSQVKENPADIASLQDLLRTLRQLELVDLPTRLAAAKSPAERERLAWSAREVAGSPWLERRKDAMRAWQTVQAERFANRVRDLRQLGIETPAVAASQRFASRLADVLGNDTGPADSQLLVKVAPLERSLHGGNLQGMVSLEFQPVVRALEKASISGHVTADPEWFTVEPKNVQVMERLWAPGDPPYKMAIQVRLRSDAETKATPAPRGILLESFVGNVAFHRVIEVPLEAAAQPVKILLSDDPKEASNLAEEIRLRPGKVRQSYFVYLKNMEDKKRSVRVEFSANEQPIAGSMQEIVLEPREVRKTPFMADSGIEDFQAPLLVRVIDPEKNIRLASRQIRVAVASPRDYVRIADLRSQPASGGTKLEVKLLPKSLAESLPIEAELQSGGVVAAAAKVKAASDMEPAQLVADGLLAGAVSNPVYVTVDGVLRSFIVQAGAELPRVDDRLAIRLKAPALSLPQASERVVIEVDNAPSTAQLELSLVRPGNGAPQFELVRRFSSPRQNRIRVRPGADGALVFDAAIEDWSVTLDTSSYQGQRILKARLLDELGRELQQTTHEWRFDRTPPEDVRFLDLPKQAKRGTTLNLQLSAHDEESDLNQVIVFRGRPVNDAMPPGVEAFVAQPVKGKPGLWTVQASLSPEALGQTPITIRATNRVGLARFETAILESLEVDPEALRAGRIEGNVFEGPRPQPKLTIVLKDAAGKETARTQTREDGTFVFEGVLPGAYRLEAVKPESGRRANGAATVLPGGVGRCDLHLSL